MLYGSEKEAFWKTTMLLLPLCRHCHSHQHHQHLGRLLKPQPRKASFTWIPLGAFSGKISKSRLGELPFNGLCFSKAQLSKMVFRFLVWSLIKLCSGMEKMFESRLQVKRQRRPTLTFPLRVPPTGEHYLRISPLLFSYKLLIKSNYGQRWKD